MEAGSTEVPLTLTPTSTLPLAKTYREPSSEVGAQCFLGKVCLTRPYIGTWGTDLGPKIAIKKAGST